MWPIYWLRWRARPGGDPRRTLFTSTPFHAWPPPFGVGRSPGETTRWARRKRPGSDPRGHPHSARLTCERAEKSGFAKLIGARRSLVAIGATNYPEGCIGGAVS